MLAGTAPGWAVTFCLRQKVTKKRFEFGVTRQNSLRAPEGSPFGQPPRVSGFIRGRFGTSRCSCCISRLREMRGASSVPNLTWFLEAGLRSEAGTRSSTPTARQPLRLGVKPQTVLSYGKASTTTHEGLYWRPKTNHQSKPNRLRNPKRKQKIKAPSSHNRRGESGRGYCLLGHPLVRGYSAFESLQSTCPP